MTSSSTHSTQVGSVLVEEEAHQQVMQLEFNQAMSDFHIMFPGVDSDVIEVKFAYTFIQSSSSRIPKLQILLRLY